MTTYAELITDRHAEVVRTAPQRLWAFQKYRSWSEAHCSTDEIKQSEFDIPVIEYVRTWAGMDSAPTDGTHCLLAIKDGAFVYTVQGCYDLIRQQWSVVNYDNPKPLAWMPNTRLPDEFKPWINPADRVAT